jgi:hypothetical protein
MRDAARWSSFHPGQEIPESGFYAGDSHRWSVNVKGHPYPPLPDSCQGHGRVLKNTIATGRTLEEARASASSAMGCRGLAASQRAEPSAGAGEVSTPEPEHGLMTIPRERAASRPILSPVTYGTTNA